MKKACSKCLKFKEEKEFYPDCTKRDGLSTACKQCLRERSKAYYDRNRERLKEERKLRGPNPYDKEYHRKWYQEKREKALENNRKRYRKQKEENTK